MLTQVANQSRSKIKTVHADRMHLLFINQLSVSPDYSMPRFNPLRQMTNGHNNNNYALQEKSRKSVLKNRQKAEKQIKGCDWFKKSCKKLSSSPFDSNKGRQQNAHMISDRYDDNRRLSKNYSRHQMSTSMLKTPVKNETKKEKRKDGGQMVQISIEQLKPMIKQLQVLQEEKQKLQTQLQFYKHAMFKQNISNSVLQALK